MNPETTATTRSNAVAVLSTGLACAGLSYVVASLLSLIDFWRFDLEEFDGIAESDVRLLDWLGLHDTASVASAVVLVVLGVIGFLGLRYVYRLGHPSLTALVIGLALGPAVHYLVLTVFRSHLLV